MIEFIIGDIHLENNWDGVDRTEDTFELLKSIRNTVREYREQNKITDLIHIIWLGDIFESANVSHRVVARFIDYLRTFHENDEHKIMKGNHDGEPKTRKGSPLLEVEVSSDNVEVIWEPLVLGNHLFLPYCTNEEMDKIKDKCINIKHCYCHLDIIGATPGTEQGLSHGLPCLLPDYVINNSKQIWAGHIHTPQIINNICVVGSIIKTSISEVGQKRIYRIDDNDQVETIYLNSRNLVNYDVNFKDQIGKDVYAAMLADPARFFKPEDIVSIRMECPHTEAHLIDQFKLQDKLRKACYHLRFDLKVLKEKQVRMKELDVNLTDTQIVSKCLENQGVSNKDLIVAEISKLIGEV